jgi:DNA modification methylase
MVETYNGNCFKIINELIEKGVKVDCIITDIPYNISKNNQFETMGRSGIDFGKWDHGFEVADMKIFPKILNKNGSIFMFHAFEQYSEVSNTFSDEMDCKDKVIWRKSNPMPRNRDRRYISNCELASWYVMKKSKWTFNRQCDTYQQMVFDFPTENHSSDRFHPTQKSLSLMEEIVKIHTNYGDTVLDPFMGSGTTGVACKKLGRNFIGIEQNEIYFQKATQRIKDVSLNIDFY